MMASPEIRQTLQTGDVVFVWIDGNDDIVIADPGDFMLVTKRVAWARKSAGSLTPPVIDTRADATFGVQVFSGVQSCEMDEKRERILRGEDTPTRPEKGPTRAARATAALTR